MVASLKNMYSTSSAFLGRQPEDSCQLTVSQCFCQELPSQRAVTEEALRRLLPQGPGGCNEETPWKEVSWSLPLLKSLLQRTPRGHGAFWSSDLLSLSPTRICPPLTIPSLLPLYHTHSCAPLVQMLLDLRHC